MNATATARRPRARAAGSMAVERGRVAHEVEQAVGDARDDLGASPAARATAATAPTQRRGPTSSASRPGRMPRPWRSASADRPPHVRLAVGHAAALEHRRPRASPRPATQPPRPAGSCRRRPRRCSRTAGRAVLDRTARRCRAAGRARRSRPTSGRASRRGRWPGGATARRRARPGPAPRGPCLRPAEGLVADRPCGGRVGGRADQHRARARPTSAAAARCSRRRPWPCSRRRRAARRRAPRRC